MSEHPYWANCPPDVTVVDEIELRCTCGACPEQYEAYLDGKQVGYLRLRHGEFYVDCPDVGGERVLYTEGCVGDGQFDPEERESFLKQAVVTIRKWLSRSHAP